MAICCRSSRDFSLIAQNTPYKVQDFEQDIMNTRTLYLWTLDPSLKKVSKSAPPFQTSSIRKPFDDSRDVPAPTDYYTANPQSLTAEVSRLQGGLYNSRSERFLKHNTDSPGPNEYRLPDTWYKKSFRHTFTTGTTNTNNIRRPKATIPSIPMGKQCAGYEETPAGDLCLQESTITSSVEGLLGPAAYNTDPKKYLRPRTMATFGKCRSRREVFKSDQNPGPGAYERTEDSGLSASMHAFAHTDSRTAIFRSGTLLAHQMSPKECEVIPGPAEYSHFPQYEGNLNMIASFGSTQKRRYQEATDSLSAPWRLRVPGPATYSIQSVFDRKKLNTHVKSKPAFCQTSDRFNGYESFQPGPGEYEVPRLMARPVHFKHNAKGGFLSNEKRLKSNEIAMRAFTPGPAKYKSVLNWGGKDGAKLQNLNSVFASKQKRFLDPRGPTQPDYGEMVDSDGKPRGDPTRLGPGCYDVCKDENSKRATHLFRRPPFSCSDLRFRRKSYSSDEQRPGPSDYNASPGVMRGPRHYSMNVHFSTQSRFKDSATCAPGPSYYQMLDRSMIKKTYNVTF